MLDRLADMDDKLDRIQKSLDEYLETKRQVTRSLGIGVRVRFRVRVRVRVEVRVEVRVRVRVRG